MNRLKQKIEALERSESVESDYGLNWTWLQCDFGEGQTWLRGSFPPLGTMRDIGAAARGYAANWADSVPQLVGNLVSLIAEKKKQELQFNLLQITIAEFERRIHRLESIQTKIVPIDSFAPEPYDLLKPIFVPVHSVEGGFNACWFDANIHASGDNEEEAVSNLKSLILDFFDTYSNEPDNALGPEPTRQLAVLRAYVHKKP